MVIGAARVALGALAGAGLLGAAALVAPWSGGTARQPEAPLVVAPVAAPLEAPPADPGPEAPRFDAVRLAPDGSGLVAGRAEPGAAVAVLADGVTVARATADAGGGFVAFFDLPPSDAPREIGLEAGRPSAETVILAPTPDVPAPAPAVLAAREPSATRPASTLLAPPPSSAAVAPSGAGPEAAAPSPVLVSDAEGVRLLAPAADAAPEALRNVALDAIAYGAEGVALSGRAAGAPGGGPGDEPAAERAVAVRVYLDGALVAEAPVAPDGTWRAILDAPPGLYDLRVDQVGAGGGVESRIAMAFLREERAEVAAALGAGPGQALAVRTVQPGNTLWAIARDRYDEPTLYVRVFEANRDRIRDPDLIYPGQVFVLPDMDAEGPSP